MERHIHCFVCEHPIRLVDKRNMPLMLREDDGPHTVYCPHCKMQHDWVPPDHGDKFVGSWVAVDDDDDGEVNQL
ncbi:MAG: hypothetical protein AMS21_00985 [Gemmatimonas sp. SG8_38_2]|nr:MAG: hypothetical protein AMS21_00985 [Gemmatimonas sp. SG8_38_2]